MKFADPKSIQLEIVSVSDDVFSGVKLNIGELY